MSGSCLDLRQYQNSEDMASIMGKLVSGKHGYKAVIEKKKDIIKCSQCSRILEGIERFCPDCGTKTGM